MIFQNASTFYLQFLLAKSAKTTSLKIRHK